jgi:hypothetical protein
MKTAFAILICGIALCGCSPSPTLTTKEDAVKVADMIVYIKQEKTGLCFGVISSTGGSPGYDTRSMSITNVPCEAVKTLLVN